MQFITDEILYIIFRLREIIIIIREIIIINVTLVHN